jgi:RNA-directed DNA polymerase
MKTVKPFEITKEQVWLAYQSVKNNKGAGGIDAQTMEEFEGDLKNNLYKIWNRMSSGSYFPKAVKAVPIPKKSGNGERILGIPTITDRIAQTVVKMYLEPILEPEFDKDSYGYRPKKSAHDAIAITRTRCWKYDYVVEFDIKGLFDNIDHKLMMQALQKHCNSKWVLLYVARWLKAPMEDRNGNILTREQGIPQGGVVSPILANLFLHYVFDKWIRKKMLKVEFCRYADDGILHCQTQKQAEYVLEAIGKRFEACGLIINREKSGIIYCKDQERKGKYERISFDFLGYRFKPRRRVNKQGRVGTGFLPAISQTSKQAIVKEIRRWHIQLKNAKTLEELAKEYNAEIRGWYGYYGRFYPSEMRKIWEHINWYLVQWVRRKYKKLAKSSIRARGYLKRIASQNRDLFIHWRLGVFPEAEMVEAV